MITANTVDRSELDLDLFSSELARAWINAAKAASCKRKTMAASSDSSNVSSPPGKAVLSETIIRSIARSEYKLLKSDLPADLLAILPVNNKDDFVSHPVVLKALFAQALRDSSAGKTLLAMKREVMESNPEYAGLRIDSMPDETMKQAAIAGMQAQARAVLEMSFGKGQHTLAASKLPAVLLTFWKKMDHALLEWARNNPALSDAVIHAARSNLGIDIIITRMIYPLIYGSPHEAHLAVPGWYASAIRSIHIEAWPAFFADFLAHAGSENIHSEIQSDRQSGEKGSMQTPVIKT